MTIPDNTILRPGQAFTKTWRLRNTGSCTWSSGYQLIRDSGDALGGPAGVGLPLAVAHNATVGISVQLVAPSVPGAYAGFWQLQDADGRRFGPTITVVIVVPDPALGETLPDELVFMYGGGGDGDTSVGVHWHRDITHKDHYDRFLLGLHLQPSLSPPSR